MLVRDPQARARHLPRALAAFRDGAPGMTAAAVATALTTHPEAVLAAFAARLRDDRGAADALDALAAVRVPALARRAAALVRGYADRHPEGAGHVAAYTARRLEQGRAALRHAAPPWWRSWPGTAAARCARALAGVLTAQAADPDGLRAELLAVLLDAPHPDDGGVDAAEAVLRAAALGAAGRPEQRTRDLSAAQRTADAPRPRRRRPLRPPARRARPGRAGLRRAAERVDGARAAPVGGARLGRGAPRCRAARRARP